MSGARGKAAPRRTAAASTPAQQQRQQQPQQPAQQSKKPTTGRSTAAQAASISSPEATGSAAAAAAADEPGDLAQQPQQPTQTPPTGVVSALSRAFPALHFPSPARAESSKPVTSSYELGDQGSTATPATTTNKKQPTKRTAPKAATTTESASAASAPSSEPTPKPAPLHVVLPGDVVNTKNADNDDDEDSGDVDMADADADGPPQQPKAVVGPGLRVVDRGGREGPVIVATKAGALRTTETVNGVSAYFVENMQRRYTPQQNEPVIGIITARMAESYRVDIGGAHPASLNYLAFEGATKRNRPQLEVGAVVYARVSLANKDMEPELECVSAATGKADGFGELKDGWVARCSLGLGRSLLRRTNPFLQALGAEMPFEVAAGSNGRVWVKAGNAKNTILAVRTLLSSEGVSGDKARELLRSQQKRLEDATGES